MILLVIEGEGCSVERAVGPPGLVEHRHVRLDPALVHQPGQHLRRAVAGVGDQLARPQIVAIGNALDHPLGRRDLRLPDGGARLDIDDDGMLHIDQVVGRVAELGLATVGGGVA